MNKQLNQTQEQLILAVDRSVAHLDGFQGQLKQTIEKMNSLVLSVLVYECSFVLVYLSQVLVGIYDHVMDVLVIQLHIILVDDQTVAQTIQVSHLNIGSHLFVEFEELRIYHVQLHHVLLLVLDVLVLVGFLCRHLVVRVVLDVHVDTRKLGAMGLS